MSDDIKPKADAAVQSIIKDLWRVEYNVVTVMVSLT